MIIVVLGAQIIILNSFTDLRTKSKEIRNALKMNERVSLTYRGKEEAVIVKSKNKKRDLRKASFFGIWKDRKETTQELLDELRRPRHQAC